MLPPLSSTARTMKIGISSDKYSVMDLSMITYWKIRERLLRVPGVANVAIWGERIEMLQVQVDPDRMAAYGVTLDEVMQVTSDTLDVGIMQIFPKRERRDRRLHRDPQPAACRSATCCRSSEPDDLANVDHQ